MLLLWVVTRSRSSYLDFSIEMAVLKRYKPTWSSKMPPFSVIRYLDKFIRHCPKTPPQGYMVTAAWNSYVEGRPQCTLGDRAAPFGNFLTGSSKTYIQGRPAARAVDFIPCKTQFISGSTKTFIY